MGRKMMTKYTAFMDTMWQRDGRRVDHELVISGDTIGAVSSNLARYIRFVLEPEIIPPEIFHAPNRNGYAGTAKGQGRHEIWYIPSIKLFCHKRVLGEYSWVNNNFRRHANWIDEEPYIKSRLKRKNTPQIFWAYDQSRPDCMYAPGEENTVG